MYMAVRLVFHLHRDFPTFLNRGPGAYLGKQLAKIQNWEKQTGETKCLILL